MPTENTLRWHLEMTAQQIFRGECLIRRQRVAIRDLHRSPGERKYAEATLISLKALQRLYRQDRKRILAELA